MVAHTPTASRGTSTPSDTIRTATIHREVSAPNRSMPALAPVIGTLPWLVPTDGYVVVGFVLHGEFLNRIFFHQVIQLTT